MDLLIVIAVWTFFGIIINNMAKKRNRDQVAWVVLSLIISPLLGAILLLLVGHNEEETPK